MLDHTSNNRPPFEITGRDVDGHMLYDSDGCPLPTTQLLFAFLREQNSLASVDDYARVANLEPGQVLDLISGHILNEVLAIEEVSDFSLFIHTAPKGRPAPLWLPQAAPNLWEKLRSRVTDPVRAAYHWWVIKALEAKGWRTTADAHRLRAGMGDRSLIPVFGVIIGNEAVGERVVPVVLDADPRELTLDSGTLARYEAGGAGAIALTCELGCLEEVSAAIRSWILSRRDRGLPPHLRVYVLEAPNYNPVLLSPDDRAVEARTVLAPAEAPSYQQDES